MKTRIILTIFFGFFISLLSSQEKLKDTLFFNLDGKYVFESKYVSNSYLLKDSNDVGRGTFFMEKISTEDNLNSKKILCLKKYVHSSKYYNKREKYKLNDFRLSQYFENYIIYLVKKNKDNLEYIRVRANFEIE